MVAISEFGQCDLLAGFVGRYKLVDDDPDVIIAWSESGLELQWYNKNKQLLTLKVDAGESLLRLKSFPAPKQGAFNQAIGKSTNTVLDTTAGWGNDSWLMCAQGYQVTMLERNPIMALLLQDYLTQMKKKLKGNNWPIHFPRLQEVDAIEYLRHSKIDVDCVYIDPMFPPKRKKSAATNKHMTFLKSMIGQDVDATKLAEAASQSNAKRLVVKRPDYAEPLLANPDQQFHSKLLHYDVYFLK